MVSFEDPVNCVYDLLNSFDWDTSYNGSPQIIKTREKNTQINQTPQIGWIWISEEDYNRKKADSQHHTENVKGVVQCKIGSYTHDRTTEITNGLEDCRRTNTCSPTPSIGTAWHEWEFLRQTKIREFPNTYERVIEYELTIHKQDIT